MENGHLPAFSTLLTSLYTLGTLLDVMTQILPDFEEIIATNHVSLPSAWIVRICPSLTTLA